MADEYDEYCSECGQHRDTHHAFVATKRPEGCVCELMDWGDPKNIPPPCPEFLGIVDGLCQTCEHEENCHKSSRRVTG